MELTRPTSASELVSAPPEPVLTYCDDATGERTELTAADLRACVNRVANLLIEGCGLSSGARVAMLLPPHWQTAAVVFGAWTAGAAVSFRGWATAGLPPVGAGQTAPYDAVFAAAHRIGNWIDDIPPAPHRFALFGRAEGDWLTFQNEISRYGSAPPQPSRGHAATVDGTSYEQWTDIARAVAQRHGVGPGDRVLVDAATHDQPLTWLLAPLAVGASVVVCANLDRARFAERMVAEGATTAL